MNKTKKKKPVKNYSVSCEDEYYITKDGEYSRPRLRLEGTSCCALSQITEVQQDFKGTNPEKLEALIKAAMKDYYSENPFGGLFIILKDEEKEFAPVLRKLKFRAHPNKFNTRFKDGAYKLQFWLHTR